MSEHKEEFEQILEFLGRKDEAGVWRQTHLLKVVSYMIDKQTEEYERTIKKLSFSCGINNRYMRENYVEGLEVWGIINVTVEGNKRIWKWVGVPIE